MSITRSMRFEVVFPGLRASDRLDTYKRVWGLQSDLTRAANRAVGVLFLLKQGTLPVPMEPPARTPTAPPRPVPLATLAYRAFSGAWQPTGQPLYAPYKDNSAACGGVRSAVAEMLRTRIDTDLKDIIAGKKALSTFRELPVCYRAAEVTLRSDDCIVLTTFEGRKNNQIVVRPRELDASQRDLFTRCRTGALKPGSATLSWLKPEGRKGKWMFTLAWTDVSHVVPEPIVPSVGAPDTTAQIVAGIDIGVSQHAAWVAYLTFDGKPLNRPSVIPFQKRIRRAVVRIDEERVERSAFNREALGLRVGRGMTRKLRVTAHIRDKIARLKETALSEIVAATIAQCKARGATLIVIEDHGEWGGKSTVKTIVDWSREARANGQFFKRSQGRMRELLLQVAEREGIKAIAVNPAYTSRICHMCGTCWPTHGVYARPGAVEADTQVGRVEWRKFVCTCGYAGHPDHNAAINIARRGLEVISGKEITLPAKKKRAKKVASITPAK